MILVLDNRDSFVYNLARYVRERGAEAVVRRSDEISLDDVAAMAPSHIIISPGPCTPHEAGISKDVIAHFGPKIPVLGVCLGHQCMAEVYRAKSFEPDGTIWLLRPKGQGGIAEGETMKAGKEAGLVDVKVVGFSPTHSAEKYVIPVKNRPKKQ